MSQQPSMSRIPVFLASAFLLLATAGFAAAFYLYDGMDYAYQLYGYARALVYPSTESTPAPVATPKGTLILPADMTEEFAINLWHEQEESQAMIERLISGNVKSLRIDSSRVQSDTAMLDVTVKLTDGSSGPGVLGLRRFEGDWYVEYATGKREADAKDGMASSMNGGVEATGGAGISDDEIDYEMINTILEQQQLSQKVIGEYVDGYVKEIIIENIKYGPNTATLNVTMKETHGTATAKIVALRSTKPAIPVWLLARFTKTGADHPDPK